MVYISNDILSEVPQFHKLNWNVSLVFSDARTKEQGLSEHSECEPCHKRQTKSFVLEKREVLNMVTYRAFCKALEALMR